MNAKEIGLQLLKMQDKEYSAFQARIIPSVKKEKIIGIRTPQLRALAKAIAKEEDTESFLQSLPHTYFEENQLFIVLSITLSSSTTRILLRPPVASPSFSRKLSLESRSCMFTGRTKEEVTMFFGITS